MMGKDYRSVFAPDAGEVYYALQESVYLLGCSYPETFCLVYQATNLLWSFLLLLDHKDYDRNQMLADLSQHLSTKTVMQFNIKDQVGNGLVSVDFIKKRRQHVIRDHRRRNQRQGYQFVV